MLRNILPKRRWVLISGITAVAVLALLIGALFVVPLVAAAQSNQNANSGNSTNYCQQYTQDLAKRLNVSVDTLNQARQGAFDDVLAQLVKDGKITQAQADKIKQYRDANKDKNACNRFLFRGLTQREFVDKYGSDVLNAIAQKLNLSADQVKTQLKSGKSLKEIAQAQGVSENDLRSTLNQALTSAIDKAVGAGDFTQSQGDAFKQALQKHPALLDHLLVASWKK